MSDSFVPTVLLVVDDPCVLVAASKVLADESCRVLTATGALRALPMIEWEDVDVVVSDIAMPEVDGVNLLQRARELFPDVVRILLSGTARLDTALKAINEAEVFRLITKPIDETELRGAIRLALARRQALRAIGARERALARRTTAMGDLERRHPGIGSAALEGDTYVISEQRLREVSERTRGSAVGRWLESDAAGERDPPAPSSKPPARGFAEEMALLRAEYLEGLAGKLDELRRATARARRAPEDPAPAREVMALAHTLRGTAGTFGLHAVGEAAGRIEDAARNHLEGATNGDAGFDEMDAALEAARESLEVRE